MFTKLFVKDMLERSLSTAAQAALIAIGGQAINKVDGGLMVVFYAALTGAVLTVLKSVAAANVGSNKSASFVVDAKEIK